MSHRDYFASLIGCALLCFILVNIAMSDGRSVLEMVTLPFGIVGTLLLMMAPWFLITKGWEVD